MADILITGATVITMDPERRVIEDGAVAIVGDRITAVGSRAEIEAAHSAPTVIDASRMVCLPGLVDVHGHAGHALVKTMDHDSFTRWRQTVELIYAEGVDEEFWYAEASLAALERLKFGTTTGLSYFGGGRMLIRTDDPVYAERHCEAVAAVGIREFLAVGPCLPSLPSTLCPVGRGQQERAYLADFDRQMATTEDIVNRWNGGADGRINVCMTSSTMNMSRPPYAGPADGRPEGRGSSRERLGGQARCAADSGRPHDGDYSLCPQGIRHPRAECYFVAQRGSHG